MIGEMVSYLNEYDEKVTGEVTDISSDRFDDVKWLMLGEPVKDKDMSSIYLEVKGKKSFDFIYLEEVIR